MHRTTINLPEPILQQAKLKALREDVTISEVLRGLLARWVAGDIQLSPRTTLNGSAWQPWRGRHAACGPIATPTTTWPPAVLA